jgi:cyclopropane fatty-acyl-phospholipid synthase-like methyltransferase
MSEKIEKFEIGCDIGNLMIMAAEEIGNPGVGIGFMIAGKYLKRMS